METFDYVIVGAGSAGSLLANRLSADGATVCVLEAGPQDRNPYIRVPAGFVKTYLDPGITWPFATAGSAGSAGRAVQAIQGRTIGGSSSINGMVFVRGQRQDYDGWAALGNPGWGYADILPHFKHLERRVGEGDDRYRGRGGELPVTDPTWRHRLCDAYIAGAERTGFARNPDYNGESSDGVGYYQRVIEGERRVSAARAFLRPVSGRASLAVRTGAHATRVVLEAGRAVGVEYLAGNEPRQVRARREVIVSAGALNSPKLLQLSGIGPAALLNSMGIPVHCDLPVGENLRDHYTVRIVARARETDTINDLVRGPRLLWEGAKWLVGRPSVLGLSATLVYAFGRSEPDMERSDYTLIFTPASYRAGFVGVLDSFPGVTSGAWQMRPDSAGFVRITSRDARQAPIVQPNYLAAERDRQVLVQGLRAIRRIFATPDLAPYYDCEELPGPDVTTDDEIVDFARQMGSSCYHFSGTCRMGPRGDRASVVDAELRVHGINALRVVDASIMPTITSGNTYAPTMMIAQKAAAMILGKDAAAAQTA